MRISDWSSDVCSSDLDLTRLLELLHGCECDPTLLSAYKGFTSPAVTYLIAALKVGTVAERWRQVNCSRFVSRQPEDPAFTLWWSLLELLVAQDLVEPTSLFEIGRAHV